MPVIAPILLPPHVPLDPLGLRRLHAGVPADRRSRAIVPGELRDGRLPLGGGRTSTTDYGRGAAISILMLVIVAAMSVFYVRRMVRVGEVDMSQRFARKLGWNAARPRASSSVMVFPVFWMISTAFKPDDQINSLTPTWFPVHADAAALPRRARTSRTSGTDVKNSRDRRARRGRDRRWCSRSSPPSRSRSTASPAARLFIVLLIGIQMLPGIGLIIPLYVVLAHVPVLHLNLVNHLTGRDRRLHQRRAAVLGLDPARAS